MTNIDEIKKEIDQMCKQDQDLRAEAFPDKWKELGQKLRELDLANEKRMREIVTEIGWPTITKVGEDISYKAWLLVQHHSLEFQQHCLKLMEEITKKNKSDILPANIAYLKDRILMKTHKKQIYGTQFMSASNGKMYLWPVQDMNNLDKLREEVGLKPFKEYAKSMGQFEITDDLGLFADRNVL